MAAAEGKFACMNHDEHVHGIQQQSLSGRRRECRCSVVACDRSYSERLQSTAPSDGSEEEIQTAAARCIIIRSVALLLSSNELSS